MDSHIKETIEKTAKFVKERGDNFEQQLLNESEKKFGFVLPEHPQHSYYKSLLSDEKAENYTPPSEPYKFQYSVYDVEGAIPSLDLEIVKRVAQFFISCKGDDEATKLEKIRSELNDEPKYQFLQTDHPLHPIFLQFVSQYEYLNSRTIGLSQFEFLENCLERAKYQEYEQEKLQKDEEMNELNKIRFAAINWENFKIVGKFEIANSENLKEALDFNIIARNEISNKAKEEYLKQYFLVEEKFENEEVGENKEAEFVEVANKATNGIANNKTKKRKGKILVKQSGETRIGKKKKKK